MATKAQTRIDEAQRDEWRRTAEAFTKLVAEDMAALLPPGCHRVCGRATPGGVELELLVYHRDSAAEAQGSCVVLAKSKVSVDWASVDRSSASQSAAGKLFNGVVPVMRRLAGLLLMFAPPVVQ